MTEERPLLGDALRAAIQQVVNAYGDLLGGDPGLVGDCLVLLEAHCGNGSTLLRHMDSDVASWRQLGMLRSAMQTLQTEEMVSAVFGCRDDNGPGEVTT